MAFVIGCLSSLVIWLITTIILTPKIKICPEISKTLQHDGKPVYRLKIINKRKRDAYGIDIYIRIRCERKFLSMKAPEVPILHCKRHSETDYERLIPFEAHLIQESRIKGLNNKELYKKYTDGILTLEDFLYNGDGEKSFEIILIAHDKFSGARKFVKALEFTEQELRNSIIDGVFKDGDDRVTPSTPTTSEETW
jgi:hypothetical protein